MLRTAARGTWKAETDGQLEKRVGAATASSVFADCSIVPFEYPSRFKGRNQIISLQEADPPLTVLHSEARSAKALSLATGGGLCNNNNKNIRRS